MKYPSVASTVFLAAVVLSPCATGNGTLTPESGVCDVGPVTKTYGHLEWLVYSCHPDPTLVFVPATDTPPSPFFFMLKSFEGTYQVISSKTIDDHHVAREALAEIKALSTEDIAALITETRTR